MAIVLLGPYAFGNALTRRWTVHLRSVLGFPLRDGARVLAKSAELLYVRVICHVVPLKHDYQAAFYASKAADITPLYAVVIVVITVALKFFWGSVCL